MRYNMKWSHRNIGSYMYQNEWKMLVLLNLFTKLYDIVKDVLINSHSFHH